VPTEEVRANVHAVAHSALPVALYNPAGKKRRHLLQEALELFRTVRGEHCLCALVRHAGRPQETKWIGTLAALPENEVDMSSLLLIGGARTVRDGDVLFEKRGYADKYAGKHGLPPRDEEHGG
jgi:cobalt-precorrin 5A hydrolase/precorrin-3B C17-methyltransferase